MRRGQYYKYGVCACVLLYVYHFFGIGDYVHSRSYDAEFDYPLSGDVRPLAEELLAGGVPGVAPINHYPHRFLANSGKCAALARLDLFIVVKSAMGNFGLRAAVRQTYGRENLAPGRTVRTLFFLGTAAGPKSDTQRRIDDEMAQHKDIIQIDFIDNYYNNTIKTMMSFRWLYEHCPLADFYLFTDDDMYISVDNLLEYVRAGDATPSAAATTTAAAGAGAGAAGASETSARERDATTFAGYVFKSAPQRFRSSKWRVSLEEYPWNKWPPYVTAGAYVTSNRAMRLLYAGSLYVKHFRFDDVYLGIVARKLGVAPTHCPRFHFYKKSYTRAGYRSVIASHGYSDPAELIAVWNDQNGVV